MNATADTSSMNIITQTVTAHRKSRASSTSAGCAARRFCIAFASNERQDSSVRAPHVTRVQLMSRCTRVQDGAQPRVDITCAPLNASLRHLQAVQPTNQPPPCCYRHIANKPTRAYETLNASTAHVLLHSRARRCTAACRHHISTTKQ